MFNHIDIIETISALIRSGGTVVGVTNPIVGVGTVVLGELLPAIDNIVNNARCETAFSTI